MAIPRFRDRALKCAIIIQRHLRGREQMRSEVGQKLFELMGRIGELRGVANVEIIHSIIVEACAFYSAKYGEDIYRRLMTLFENPGVEANDVMEQPRYMKDLFYKTRSNMQHGIDPPDSSMNMQELLPYELKQSLRRDGATEEEIYGIFVRGVDNVSKNQLPLAYKDNAHVLKEGYHLWASSTP